jgi:putative tricarboxylic transport membrane protein
MMGALLMLGIQPGPLLFTQHPDIAWGLIASMFVGNIALAIINIPLAGILVRVLSIPAKILYPLVLGLAFVGCYAISNSVVDFYLLTGFGILGYVMSKVNLPTAPLVLGCIVGATMEQSYRQAITISNGSMGIFIGSPVAIGLIVVTFIAILYPSVKSYFTKKKINIAQ